MPTCSPDTLALLRLTLTPNLGPVRLRRCVETLGSIDAVLNASPEALVRVRGLGREKAAQIAAALPASEALARDELALANQLGVRLIGFTDPDYPPLLAQLADAPPLLYIRGMFDAAGLDRYPLAVVGSRACSHYGLEQSDRFAASLAQSGITIVSGGARGIDTAAHKAALRVGGRTIVVLGCGLAECYPPDNRELFDQIVAPRSGSSPGGSTGSGAIISELPLRTAPRAENFPARNRIISGLSLGTLVIEAARRSGALITARVAAEDHGREVFALPSRVDSESGLGTLDLLKSGGAALVTHPDDILQQLEGPARHHFAGTHEARYAAAPRHDDREHPRDDQPAAPSTEDDIELATTHETPPEPTPLFAPRPAPATSLRNASLTEPQQRILAALNEPRSMDELARATDLGPAALRAEITMLEIKRRVQRQGPRIRRLDPAPGARG